MIVWVTRDEDEDGPLCRAIRARGLSAVLEPVLTRRVVDDASAELARCGPDDWLVLTSVFAVEAIAPEPARVPRVAVVGEATRRAAEARGFRVSLVSRDGTGKGLFDELQATIAAAKICYPRSSLVPPPEPWGTVEIVSPVLYETVPRGFDRRVMKRVDVAAVASPSAVRAIGRVDLPFASIGPTTSAALRELCIEPWVEARERSFESLADAIAGQADTASRHQRA